MRFQVTAISLACITLLSGCGGGSGSGSDSGMAQSVSFPFPGGPLVGIPPAVTTTTLMATASSGGPITYTSNTPTTCTVSGSTLSLLAVGECSVTATQPGVDGYAPASAKQLFVIPKNPQTLQFRNPGAQPLDAQPVLLAAVSSATRPVTFTTSTPTVCSISGSNLLKLANGVCTVTATQDGGAIFDSVTMSRDIPIGTATAPVLNFLSGYKDGQHTKEGGAVDPQGGSSEGGWWCNNWCSMTASADGSTLTGIYDFKGTKPAAGNWWTNWMNIDLYAAGLAQTSDVSKTANTMVGARIDAQAAIKFNLAETPEWAGTGNTAFTVDIYLGHLNRIPDGTDDKGQPKTKECNVTLRANGPTITPAAAVVPTNYSINLRSQFTILDACGLTGLDMWNELQDYPIIKVRFGSVNGNLTAQTPGVSGTSLQTGFKIGAVSFQ